jgi:hypothetical protein
MNIKIIVFIFLIIALTTGYIYGKKITNTTSVNQETKNSDINITESIKDTQIIDDSKTQEAPESFKIENVSFASQAPLGNWDHLHEEACEEASLIMVDYYLNNKTLNSQVMEDQIQKMVTYEEKYFGKSDMDLTITQEKTLAQNYYNISPEIKPITSINDIKKEIAQNHIVIVPAAGRMLDNPNYTAPGPIYHMLVITGYTPSRIITNDAGTRKGLNFTYSYNNLWNSIHDWAGSADNITTGQKIMLVF